MDGRLNCSFLDFLAKEYEARGLIHCPPIGDNFLCWPPIQAGSNFSRPCPNNDGKFGSMPPAIPNATAVRGCFANGTWWAQTDYSECLPYSPGEDIDNDEYMGVAFIIITVGLTISLVALIVAMLIFVFIRSLWCLRNKIHMNLMASFILYNTVWLLITILTVTKISSLEETPHLCRALNSLQYYAQLSNFFWMLMEGLYLHISLVWTYKSDRVRFIHYATIGWGIPVPIILIWIVVRLSAFPNKCWMVDDYDNVSSIDSHIKYIILGPIMLVLLINVLFLVSVIFVLVTKLRDSNTNQAVQYRKAARAILILLPLLGLTYILFAYPVSDKSSVFYRFRLFFNAVMSSTQVSLNLLFVVSYLIFGMALCAIRAGRGLWVALIYCFLNQEVRSNLSRRIKNIQTSHQYNSTATTRHRKTAVNTISEPGTLKSHS